MTPPSERPSLSTGLPDLVAGLSVAGLLVPEAIAYASIAALPPQHGVIALLAGLICYGLVGRSRFAIVSATSSSAAVLAATTASLAGGDATHRLALAIGLVLLTGAFFLIAGVARMGGLSAFIAKPVLRGFTFGLALVIIIRQLPAIVGVGASHEDFFHYAFDLLAQFDRWHPAGVAMGLCALAVLMILKRWRRLPASLLLIVLGIAAQTIWQVDRHGVGLVGEIDVQFRAVGVPELTRGEWLRLGELAFAMVFVLYAESYGSVRGFALMHGDRIYPNRELYALGLSNLVSGLFGGLPVGAGYSGTSANEAAGARSRMAAWAAALVVLMVVFTLLPLLAHTPQPVLAAVVINAVSHTLRPGPLRIYFRWQRDRLVLVFAIAAVLLLGILDGLLVAVGASLLLTLRDLSRHRLSVLGRLGEGHDFVSTSTHPRARQIPGLMIIRPEAPLFFANADQILTRVRRAVANSTATRCVILSLEESPDLDGSSIEGIAELAAFLDTRGIRLLLARLHDPARAVLIRAHIPHLPVSALIHWSVDDAVSAALGTKA
ncbi:MAG: SulP family inorganic anion transporter [Rhodocyclaceae bacterium]|nr:SulP family inorganic anion transporter [Rhodocyclaceae bacterium]MCP5254952.1 SulP family inorganic anion transporter [Zoogloeaceae bacterium]MCP5295408.1 SulP family inorganic anion transporter [Zoogloeaceae bacterium]MCW5614454.1 SulP family inorganic anion transporter [Rhodocyclaceae bacterium]